MPLPASVIKKDHDLEQDYETIGSELMELRWHWTLDESNSKRVSIRQYARDVGRAESVIRADVNGWAANIEDDAASGSARTGVKKKPNEYREMAKINSKRQHAAEAIAKATGNAISTVARTKRDEIASVVSRAEERAVKQGTTVEEEIDRAAEWDAKARRSAAKQREENKARHTSRYIEIEGYIGVAIQKIRQALDCAENVGFSEEETDLMTVASNKLRAVLTLFDLRITGTADIDWDAELQKIGE